MVIIKCPSCGKSIFELNKSNPIYVVSTDFKELNGQAPAIPHQEMISSCCKMPFTRINFNGNREIFSEFGWVTP